MDGGGAGGAAPASSQGQGGWVTWASLRRIGRWIRCSEYRAHTLQGWLNREPQDFPMRCNGDGYGQHHGQIGNVHCRAHERKRSARIQDRRSLDCSASLTLLNGYISHCTTLTS